MMAEELQESYKSLYLIHNKQTHQYVTDLVFILDFDSRIKHFSASTQDYPGLNPASMLGVPFTKYLDKKSKISWKELLVKPLEYPQQINLQLKVHKKLSLPVTFFLNELKLEANQNYLMLTGVRLINILKQGEKRIGSASPHLTTEEPQTKSVLKREVDVRIIKEIHDHILTHLDQSLISLKDLAHNFGTNEYKLKKGFKELYGTTVYRFQMEERLKKAALLLESTKIQVKVISKLVGFTDVAHFSRSFKKKYGYSPSQLRKMR
ncbi:MAG: hypothetical protein COA80_17980 [Leeuwenhoekiella sp.]|nr:MAG: hypothetical protein COA80_17980 [Leeuwenhoekiella sp.]